jgi:hypothetical protein
MSRALTLAALMLPGLAAAQTCPQGAPDVAMDLGTFAGAELVVEATQRPGEAGLDTCVLASWTAPDGTMLRQPLVMSMLPGPVQVARDADVIVLTHPGGSDETPGTTYTTRYSFHEQAQRFLAGQVERSDPWGDALGALDARLAAGDLLGARAQIARMDAGMLEGSARALVQASWVRGACALSEALAAEEHGDAAAIVALASLARPPVSGPQAMPEGHLAFSARSLSPGGEGDWVLPADEGMMAALDGCATGLAAGGELGAAESLSKIVVSFDPRQVGAQVRLGDMMWDAGRTDEARRHYLTAMSIAGSDAPPRVANRIGNVEPAPVAAVPVPAVQPLGEVALPVQDPDAGPTDLGNEVEVQELE